MRISDLLTFNRGKNLFLPAHGRGKALPRQFKKLLKNRPGVWDLPELPDLGSPICSEGAISSSQEKSAKDFGVDHCWYGVNGATGLLQAALLSMVKPGKAVLMPRNVHKSLIQACILGDIRPLLFDLPYSEDRGHYFPPDLNWLKKVFAEIDSAALEIEGVVLVNPTYHGYSTDLKPLIDLLHQKRLPVLIDEAHGTYFVSEIKNDLPISGLKTGADLVVHSLHKSATGLVQTAVLWSQGQLVDPLAVERSIGLFQTSSPSALFLASCELSLRELSSKTGKKNLLNCLENANEVRAKLLSKGMPLLDNDDPLRLILHSSSIGINGFDADNWFLSNGIVAELPEPGTLTFCLGFGPHRRLVNLLSNCWKDLATNGSINRTFPPFDSPKFSFLSSFAKPCSSSFFEKSTLVLLNEAAGFVSAELISPYPPGIPILIPGEVIDQQRVNWMIEQQNLWPNQIPHQIRVLS